MVLVETFQVMEECRLMKRQAGFYQEAIIANPKNLRKQVRLNFLVDTGSSGTAIPREVAKQLKLEPIGKGWIQLADGSKVKIQLAYLYLKINGDNVFTICSYNGCADPLLGFDVMHVLGLHIDTEKKRLLRPIRRFWLKDFILKKGLIGNRSDRRRKKSD